MTTQIDLKAETIYAKSYAGLVLSRWSASGCRFFDCDFTNMRIKEMGFGVGSSPTLYERCVFDGSKYVQVAGLLCDFLDCSFEGVNFNKVQFVKSSFRHCRFAGTLSDVVFWGSIPPEMIRYYPARRIEFTDNDFSRCALQGVSFKGGIDLPRQRLPTSPSYSIVRADPRSLEHASEEVDRWPDDERTFGRMMMEILAAEASLGQSLVFVREEDVVASPSDQKAWTRLAGLLAADESKSCRSTGHRKPPV